MKAIEIIREAGELRKDVLSQILNPDLVKLRAKFRQQRFDIRIVGGAVRDILSNRTPKDIDLCTDANPNEQIEIYKAHGYRYIETGLQHGTITVVLNNEPYEITSLRTETDHDGRHATVSYTKDWIGDLSRRDLTMNSMAMTFDGELIDPFHGKEDLENGIVRFVGDPANRMKEDYLRILRYFRFSGRFGTSSDKETENAIRQCAVGLKNISGERIWMEVSKILVGRNAEQELYKMYQLGVAQNIGMTLPPFLKGLSAFKGGNPITALAYVVDANTAKKLNDHWKFSSSEYKMLMWLIDNKSTVINLPKLQNFVVDGINPEWVAQLAILHRQPHFADQIRTWNPPMFPVNGEDLKSIGVKPGPEFGNTLKRLKDQWKQSGFKLSKEQLLSQVGKQNEKTITPNTNITRRMQSSS
jgi:tRNA nucleotidyltransferase (CCA-adding enzyme)